MVDFGIRFRTEGANFAQQQILGIGRTAEEAARSANRLEQVVGRRGLTRAFSGLQSNLRSNSFAVTNAANQFSDLAVQIGAGVPVTRALSQQLPQLTAFMGPLAAIIGVVSGVAIGAAGAFLSFRNETEEFVDVAETAISTAERLRDANERVGMSASAAREEYGAFTEEIRRLDELEQNRLTEQLQRDLLATIDLFDAFGGTISEALRDTAIAANTGAGEIGAALFESLATEIPRTERAVVEGILAIRDAFEDDFDPERLGDLILGLVEDLRELNDPTYAQQEDALASLARQLFLLAGDAEEAAGRVVTALESIQGFSIEFQAAQVRAGVADGSIPPAALDSLGPSAAERTYQRGAEAIRRVRARQARAAARSGGGGGGGMSEAEQEARRLESLAERVYESTRTELEKEAALREDYNQLLQRGLISQDTYNRAINDLHGDMEGFAADVGSIVSGELSSAFSDVINGTKTVGEALTDFAENVLLRIADQLFEKLIAAPLENAIVGAIGGIVPSADGNAFDRGIVPFAKGGVVSSPTLFTFAKGGRLGLMGEAGPEAVLPLSRGADGKLGVKSSGGGGATQIVINNYTNEQAEVQDDGSGKVEVTIGRVLAQDIRNGGPTYQAIKQTFGLRQPSIGRG